MRTTVNIDPSLLHEAKAVASRRRCSLGRVIDDALRAHLTAEASTAEPEPFQIRPFGGQLGLRPGVDLEDKEAMAELLGDNEFPWRR